MASAARKSSAPNEGGDALGFRVMPDCRCSGCRAGAGRRLVALNGTAVAPAADRRNARAAASDAA
jgi:hypothetical protein